MCGFVSSKVKQFTGERVFWKVVVIDFDDGLLSGFVQGISIKVGRWRKAERLLKRDHDQFNREPEGNFFGFNVFRKREQAEEYRYRCGCNGGKIARVVAKGGYRNATTDEGVSCLLVEWIKILEVFE